MDIKESVKNLYLAIDDIVKKDLIGEHRSSVYNASHICKRILNLHKMLEEYVADNSTNNYFIPSTGWLRLLCPFGILFQAIDEMSVS